VPHPMKPLCVHCQRKRPSRPRGLCWTCYYTPGLRHLYPPLPSEAGRRYHPLVDFFGQVKLPTTPLVGWPGSAERIASLASRAGRNEDLFAAEGTP